jgi:hypothetical protein
VAQQAKDLVSCQDCLNAVVHCMGARHQFQQYYREGEFSKCSREISELKFCLKLKAAPTDKAQEMLRELLATDTSTTDNVIWEVRKPGDRGF